MIHSTLKYRVNLSVESFLVEFVCCTCSIKVKLWGGGHLNWGEIPGPPFCTVPRCMYVNVCVCLYSRGMLYGINLMTGER